MACWLVKSRSNAEYVVRVGDCSREHAESVLRDLTEHPQTPSDLELHRETALTRLRARF